MEADALEESGESYLDYEDADGDEKEQSSVVYDEMEPNLVGVFRQTEEGKKALRKIGRKVCDDYQSAWDSSEEYRDRFLKDCRLFAGELPAKTFPFEHCANVHIPMMLENISRVVTRAEGEIFGDWKNVFGVMPIHKDDEEVARVLTKHGNWQLRHQITDFRRQMSRSLFLYFMAGDFTVSSYWDSAKQRNRHEVLSCDEFVIPYVFTSTEVDYSDVPFLCKILRRYPHELQRMRGEWHGVDKLLKRKPSWEDEPDQNTSTKLAEASGRVVPADSAENAPYKLLDYCGWMDLPNQEEQRYCKAIVDHATGTVLLLQIYEEEDWQGRVRYDRQVMERDAYLAQMEVVQQAEQQAQLMRAQPPDPLADPDAFNEHAARLRAIDAAPVPAAPEWMAAAAPGEDGLPQPELPKMVPIHMYTHGVCIEPMAGSLGMGYGRIQGDMNRAVNVAMSQYIDSATLANCQSYITAGNINFAKPFSIKPGTVNIAKNVSQSELNSAFKELRAGPANEQLVNLIRMIYEWAASSVQAPSVLSGEAGKSGETYGGITSRLEQATKQLSVFTQRYAYPLENVLKNNARLNEQFLSDEEIIYVNDSSGLGGEELRVSRDMYTREYRVEISSDMRFTSQQEKIGKADELIQLPQAVPPLQASSAFIYQTLVDALLARGKPELVRTLGPPPPIPDVPLGTPPPPPPGMGGPPPPGMEGQPPGVEPGPEGGGPQ